VLFDRATNIALVLALLFVGFGLWRKPASEGRLSPAETYKVGETLPSITGFEYRSGAATLVLFIHSKCHFCTETMPVYREVRETLSRQRRSDIRLVAIARQPKSELDEYLATQKLTTDYASSIDGNVWQKLAGTPTLFLVDNKGVVKQIWRGKQTSSAVATIVTVVGRLGS
jgi:peroxiredoxin